MSPALSVIIVSWNSGALLSGCLPALQRSADAAGAELELVVVDNGSADDSKSIAREAGARILENDFNAGFVVAASQGLAVARAPWLMLANPDLTVREGFIGAILRAAEEVSDEVASLVPDIRFASDPRVVNSRGITVDDVGIPAEWQSGRLASPPDDVDVFGASSSASIIRTDALRTVGGLEPAYFAYLEDVDLAWRLRKAGYRASFVPDAVAVHEGSASTGQTSKLKTYLVARNRRLLFLLHGPRTVRARAFRTVTELGHASVQVFSGTGTASFRGRLDSLGHRPYVRFLRASNDEIGTRGDEASIRLTPRVTLLETLRRKQKASDLMRR